MMSSPRLLCYSYSDSGNDSIDESTDEGTDYSDSVLKALHSGEWQLTTTSGRQTTTERMDTVLVIVKTNVAYHHIHACKDVPAAEPNLHLV